MPRQAQTPCVPIGNPSEQGFVVMSDVPLPSAVTDISGCAVPSCTHQSFMHVCPCGHSGLSVVQRHTRSAGGSEKQDDRTSKERTASLMLFLLVRWLERIGGWGWSRWAALIKPLHHLVEILRQATCARIRGQSANLVIDRRRHLATSNQDWDVARFTWTDGHRELKHKRCVTRLGSNQWMTADYRRNQRAIGVAPCRSKRNSAEVGCRRDWSGTSGDPNPHLSIVLGTGGRKRDRGDVNSRLDVRDRRSSQV